MSVIDHSKITRCWSSIGVWGDHSCPELKNWVHCQNCPVLQRAGRSLFHQTPPADYLDDWERLLADTHDERAAGKDSQMIFRLGAEWLGLPASIFRSIEDQKTVHRIPHRSNKILLGVVNIQGGLQLCISLQALLEIGDAEEQKMSRGLLQRERLACVERGGDKWVFPVDEVMGIHRYLAADVQNVPVTVAKSSASFTRGLLAANDKTVGLLDDELVFYHLKRSALG